MDYIELTDVTLRDGLQMESRAIPVGEKLELYLKLLQCGYQRIEITSLVSPKWVPQFADSEELLRTIFSRHPNVPSGVELMAFVPNEKGLQRLLPFPVPWVSLFIASSEEFNRRNVNQTIDESLKGLAACVRQAKADGRKTRIYVSTVFGCPYQGAVRLENLISLWHRLAALQPDEIALSDTIGVATPQRVREVLDAFWTLYPPSKTALHFHNTYGLAIAAAEAAYQKGARKFDGATGGTGGCPYAKGASGNVATEELAYLFYRESVFSLKWAATYDTLKTLDKRLGIHPRSHLYEIAKNGGQLYGIEQ